MNLAALDASIVELQGHAQECIAEIADSRICSSITNEYKRALGHEREHIAQHLTALAEIRALLVGLDAAKAELAHAHDAYAALLHNHDAAYAAAGHTHAVYEPANANIQTHVTSAHAPANAQKNSDITKAEIEAKLTGEIASHTHAGGSGAVWTTVKKAADTARTNSTLAADPDLQFTMAGATKYAVRGKVFFDTNATADFKWRHVGPPSPSLARIARNWVVPAGTAFAGILVDAAFSAADLAVLGSSGNGGYIEFEGIVHTATGGTFSFSWAQNTTNAGAATVRAGSYLEYMVV